MPRFEVYKDAAGKTRFRLKADNHQIVAVGEAYEQHASCIKGIRSIQRNSNVPIEDLTVAGSPPQPNPKYVIYCDSSGEFRFRLKAANGEIIAQGEGYTSKTSCLLGIQVVRDSVYAEIDDPFAKEPEVAVAEEIKPDVVPTVVDACMVQKSTVVCTEKVDPPPKKTTAEPTILFVFPLFGVELAANIAFGTASFIINLHRAVWQTPPKSKP
jgi:uncharacterized protein